MLRGKMRTMSVAVFLVSASCSDEAVPKDPASDPKARVADAKAIEGL